jgi:hypothetical protein
MLPPAAPAGEAAAEAKAHESRPERPDEDVSSALMKRFWRGKWSTT